MEIKVFIDSIKSLFLSNDFELCDESIDQEYGSLSFIKKDFKVEASLDLSDSSLFLSLDRPFYGFNRSTTVKNMEEVTALAEDFIAKINTLITEDSALPKITKNDCELFLKTGSYDGMSSGVIEYQGSLYYIQSITNPYLKDKSKEDSKNRVWRHFYVFEMTKEELEKVVMSSLDWLRHINLSSLCKDWKSLNQSTSEDEAEHKKFFDGKYNHSFEAKNKPVMKLTLFY